MGNTLKRSEDNEVDVDERDDAQSPKAQPQVQPQVTENVATEGSMVLISPISQPVVEVELNVIPEKKLDAYTKHEIIEYIQKMKPTYLNYDDLATNLLNVGDIFNTKLIQMNVELYNNMVKKLPPLTNDKPKDDNKKKKKYVKPTFDLNKVADELLANMNTKDVSDQLPIDLNVEITKPIFDFNVNPITLEEYKGAFREITTKMDMMGINKKTLSMCSDHLKYKFVNLFNKICKDPSSYVNDHSFGRVTFMYKDAKKGPTDNVSSFRQITAIPTITNHLHRILALRLSQYLIENNYIDTTIQKGSVPGLKFGIFEQIYKVKNVIKYANTSKTEVCITFIDITNAYPSLKLSKMLEIMEKYHVPADLISYIKMFYDNFEYYLKAGTAYTKPIKWKDGLIQGCPLSPILFVLVLNYILKHLNNKYKETSGFSVKNGKVLFTAYVDDLCLITKDAKTNELVLRDLEKILLTFGFSINKTKSGIMHINPTEKVTTTDIKQIANYKYLGETLSSDGTIFISYGILLRDLMSSLQMIDNSKDTAVLKMERFNEFILPHVQRKVMVLYDLTKEQQDNIISLINKYYTKWDPVNKITLMYSGQNPIHNTADEVITDMDISDEMAPNTIHVDIVANTKKFRNLNVNMTYTNMTQTLIDVL